MIVNVRQLERSPQLLRKAARALETQNLSGATDRALAAADHRNAYGVSLIFERNLGPAYPFTMKSADQFLPAGPTPLTSERWVAEYNETRLFGDTNSPVRTPAQGEIGLFWAVHTGQQYSRAFGYLVGTYKLDVMDSARMLAMLWTGYADTVIGCWNANFTYNFWRPVTAIRAGGGNPELMSDPMWTSSGTTPNHREYPAAHGCVTGVSSSLVADFFWHHESSRRSR